MLRTVSLTFVNRQFLAINQTQTFRYRPIKQNQAFCTVPLSKTRRSVPDHETKQSVLFRSKTKLLSRSIKQKQKLFKESFHIILTCAFLVQKHFYVGPSAKRKHSATGPLSRPKGFVTVSGNNTKNFKNHEF